MVGGKQGESGKRKNEIVSFVWDMDATNKYYTEISDLISLKAPSKDKLSRAIEASKQSLSETEKRLAAFNGKQATSELDAILNNQNKGLTKVSGGWLPWPALIVILKR